MPSWCGQEQLWFYMCLNTIITDMIWHQCACSALFFPFVLLIHLLSSNADLHIPSVTKHCPITMPGSHTTAGLFTSPVAVRLMSLPDLTHSSVKQLLAVSLRCDSKMRCSAPMSETQCTQTQTQQSSTELLDTGGIRTNFHFCIIQTQEKLRSDTSTCLAVMLSTCRTL